MSTLGSPVPTNGMVAIDETTSIRQGNNINYTFLHAEVIPRLEVGVGYVEIGNIKISSDISSGYVLSVLYSWDNSNTIEWTAETTINNANINYTISGLKQFEHYKYFRDYILIETFLTTETGSYSFNYSGPWTSHVFAIKDVGPSVFHTHAEYGSVIIVLIIIALIAIGLLFFRYKEEYTITGLLYLLIGIFVGGILLSLAVITFWI
jgi:hypothetical protein